MVNPVDPNSSPQGPQGAFEGPKTVFNPDGSATFLGMNFTATEWKDFMTSMSRTLSEYINKRMQRALERMKEDWRKARNED